MQLRGRRRRSGSARPTCESVPPLRPEFLVRLLKSVDLASKNAAVLCAEILGWQERRLTDPIERWVALAALVPSELLERWMLDGRDDLSAAMRLGDRLAEAGVPVGLRLTLSAWQQFLASPDWDKPATRWRHALTMGARRRRRSTGPTAASHRFLTEQVPAALPMLAAAQAALRRQTATDLGEARSAAEALLFAVLNGRPQTRGRFNLNETLDFSFGGRPAEGDLVAPAPRVVVEIDGYHHFQQAERYRRDRRKDLLLQQHGWLVMRCLAEDVVIDLERIVNEIEAVLARRAVQASHESR